MMTYNPLKGAWNRSTYFEETITICKNIKYLKERSGLSYKKLSVELGFRPGTLSNYIHSYYRPNTERLNIIVKHFGIENVEDLCLPTYEFEQKYHD